MFVLLALLCEDVRFDVTPQLSLEVEIGKWRSRFSPMFCVTYVMFLSGFFCVVYMIGGTTIGFVANYIYFFLALVYSERRVD